MVERGVIHEIFSVRLHTRNQRPIHRVFISREKTAQVANIQHRDKNGRQ